MDDGGAGVPPAIAFVSTYLAFITAVMAGTAAIVFFIRRIQSKGMGPIDLTLLLVFMAAVALTALAAIRQMESL